ncbi:hypothetical protein K2173_028052 [Erythroxylum novogranatense]|uniref:Uncharacterized protein n=1 Tax=Erythroxylum novogranatense TaxID=1862640 RepID=A0AAV8U4F1_9ROSI|nr:hypothetical protein K2173_028052 [Erythroxylum novogranatense]
MPHLRCKSLLLWFFPYSRPCCEFSLVFIYRRLEGFTQQPRTLSLSVTSSFLHYILVNIEQNIRKASCFGDMEVVIPSTSLDFDFNNARPLPFFSTPSTPRGFGDLSLSAPASPTRVTEFYRYFDSLSPIGKTRPASPNGGGNDDFAFDFSADLEKASLPADELFDGGKIRPLLAPPSGLQVEDQKSPLLSPRSPRSPLARGKEIVSGVFSKKKDSSTKPSGRTENVARGRDLTVSSSRRATRSVSPHRVAQYPWEEEDKSNHHNNNNNKHSTSLSSNTSSSSTSSSSSSSSKSSSRKWSLRDFLLFRSASEGRASDKDPLRKYWGRKQDEVKNTNTADHSKRKGRVSAHELHYTTNKAASQDLKKKTFLPYKQGILGRLAFSPILHAHSNGFGSTTR